MASVNTRNLKDPQQRRVYAWEAQWADWNARACTLGKAREYVSWACGLYRVKPPRVRQHPGNEYSFSQGDLISFNHSQVNRAIALHEAAHYICDHLFDVGDQHHCREWFAIYLWLLIKARIAPIIALFASARAKRIRWLPLWQISPKRLAGRAGKKLTLRTLRAPAR
jgi:hypothetical protein